MLKIECIECETNQHTIFSRFLVGPIKRGQGTTVGNVLRRVLLSGLQGLAIVGIRIKNIGHEFEPVSYLREDIIDIILNLKQVVLKGSLTEPGLAKINFQGPGFITAGDIDLPNGVEVIEPRQYIATVTTSELIELDLFLKVGEGYAMNDYAGSRLPKGFLLIDATYMPVIQANFFIETLKGDGTPYIDNIESLVLEITTNGSIDPVDAISAAAERLENFFSTLRTTDFFFEPLLEEEAEKEPEESFDEISVARLSLSPRASNCLDRANIRTLADLANYSRSDLLSLQSFGQKSVDEIASKFEESFNYRMP